MGEEISESHEALEAIKATKKRNWGLWLQVVPGVVGMFIGVLALYAALTEAEAVRKQQQATVWPYVELAAAQTGVPGERDVTLTVTNKGIGPARILYFDAVIGGVSNATWQEVFFALLADRDDLADMRFVSSDEGLTNTVLSPEEKVRFFHMSQMDAERVAAQQDEEAAEQTRAGQLIAIEALLEAIATDRIIFNVCYCSVFDDCWAIKSNSRERNQVDLCPAPQFDPAL